jgi:hypothetical protein
MMSPQFGVKRAKQPQMGKRRLFLLLVMPGRVPGIHGLAAPRETWMAGTTASHDDC